MGSLLGFILAQEQHVEEVSEARDLYPHLQELIVAALGFAIIFFFMAKWVFPRVNAVLEERRRSIQQDLESAERAKLEAEESRRRYEEQIRDARGEANRIIEEARKTAEAMRKDLVAKAEEEARQTVARAQDEIRAERERAFDDLRRHVGELSVTLAERVVGEELNRDRHMRLVDDYIEELNGKGRRGGKG